VSFYERQAQNRRRTLLFLAGFVVFFALFGVVIDVAVEGFLEPGGAPLPFVSLIAMAVSVGLGVASYYKGGRLVLLSLQATPLRPANPEHRQLLNIVTEIAIAAGVPRPAVYVIPDPSPNAMATGRDPEHAALAVTEGALLLLDREETQAVVAHEIGHIANRDTLTMTVIGVLLGAVVMLADWARRSIYYTSGSKRRGGGVYLLPLVLLLALVAPLLSRILAMAVSRQREYLADASAVEFTRNPLALARALEHIGSAVSPLRGATRGTAHLFITDPLHRRSGEREGRLADLLSTHPPLSRRIAILRQLAQGGLGA
jgi:heat shock protein HtpX